MSWRDEAATPKQVGLAKSLATKLGVKRDWEQYWTKGEMSDMISEFKEALGMPIETNWKNNQPATVSQNWPPINPVAGAPETQPPSYPSPTAQLYVIVVTATLMATSKEQAIEQMKGILDVNNVTLQQADATKI